MCVCVCARANTVYKSCMLYLVLRNEAITMRANRIAHFGGGGRRIATVAGHLRQAVQIIAANRLAALLTPSDVAGQGPVRKTKRQLIYFADFLLPRFRYKLY